MRMILGHPLLGAQVAEHRVLVRHNENNCTHLCFVRKRSPRDFFSILLELNPAIVGSIPCLSLPLAVTARCF